MSKQLKIELREPSPDDYRRASLKPHIKHEVEGKIKTTPLEYDEIKKLFNRAKDIEEKGDDEKDFFRREKSVKPPRKGDIVEQSFPPPVKLEKPKELLKEEEEIRKELKIIRYLPESQDVDTIAQIVVTFNQPMIPLTGVDDLKKLEVPVSLTPEIEGEWRYIGTKTVKWKPAHRIPKSTEFVVTVKKGVKSEWGCEMKADFSFKFTTIPIRIKKMTPCNVNVGQEVPVILEFNQRIHKDEIFKYLQAGVKNNEIVEIKKEELLEMIDKEGVMEKKLTYIYNSYKSHLKNAIDGTFVLFRFKKKLPLHSNISITVKSGCGSAEGPRKSKSDLTQSFRTYGPFRIRTFYPTSNIVPNQSWSIDFTNNIELDEFKESDIDIKPKIEKVKITPSGSSISIHGQTKGNTNYVVTCLKSMVDIYGQHLEESKAEFSVGRATQQLYGFFNDQIIVHDMVMNDKPEFSLVSINLKEIHLRIYQVEPWEVHKSFCGSDYWYFHAKFKKQNNLSIKDRINCGIQIHDEILVVPNKPDELVETIIDLTKFLQHPDSKCGQLVVYAEPVKKGWKKNYKYRPIVRTWIQVTNLAVDAFSSYGGEIYSFCSTLTEGRPVEGCKFSLIPNTSKYCANPKKEYKSSEVSVIGDKEGVGLFSLKEKMAQMMMICKKGNDVCFVKNINHHDALVGRNLSYIVNDRNLYKPKETVSIKGILRILNYKTWEKKLTIPGKGEKIKYIFYDPRGSKLKEGEVTLNEFGSFFLEIELPDNVNLGTGRVHFRGLGIYADHYFKIQEFRTPEFTSRATVDNGDYFPNGVAIVNGVAEYFSGGGLAGCDVTWKISQSDGSYVPPNFSFQGYNFTCGYSPVGGASLRSSIVNSASVEGKFAGKTDGSGDHKLCVDFRENDEVEIKKPTNVSCNLNIQDINRQMMSSSTSFLVHPSSFYVGMKKKKHFARIGDIVNLDLIVTDLDGAIQEGVDIEMTIYRREYVRKGYEWKQVEVKEAEVKFVSKKEPVEVDLKMEKGGTYYFVCKIHDHQGMSNFSSVSLWVAGGKERGGGSRVQEEAAKLIGNKKEFEVGDEAKILVTSPFSSPASGLMLVCCNGFTLKQRFSIKKDSAVLKVPILKEYVPGCQISVYLSGLNDRIDESTGRPSLGAPKRPAFAKGSIALSIPPKIHTLDVEVTPDRKIMKPGDEGKVSLKVKSKVTGKFVQKTAVSLIIVDEAVLSLTGYNIPSPIGSFIQSNQTYVQNVCLRTSVVMKDWNSIVVEAPPRQYGGYGGGGGGLFSSLDCLEDCCCCCARNCMCERCCCCREECCEKECDCKKPACPKKKKSQKKSEAPMGGEAPDENAPIEVRTDFRPLCCFRHDTVTDKEGTCVIDFKLPDNLTKYRVWCIAHSQEATDLFGLGESSIQAQLPVAIRPSLPRFLNFGDKALFTVVVQNQTLSTVEVKIAVRMTNLRLTEVKKQGVLVSIPYAQRAELRFPVVTHQCGTGRFQVIGSVVGTKFSDAVEKELPIFTPTTSEAFATYGEMDGDSVVIQAVEAPESVYNQFGGLSITTSSTALQSLTDAFLYLYHYKFDCVEQISSRMLSINALQKFLYEFNVPKMPSKGDLKKVMLHGFKKIRGSMRSDGALGFWSLISNVNIYLSIFVAHNLIRCKEAGYAVDNTLLNRSKSFCTNVDSYFGRYCNWYSESSKASLRAFALYVLTIYGIHGELSGHEKDKLSDRAEQLYKNKKKYFSHEGLVWLAFCLFITSRKKESHPIVKEIMKFINQNVEESPETAHFITSYADDGKLVMLHSDRRTDAVILEMMCHVDPKNYLIPKIVKGLMAHKKKGRWRSTQENVYILMALKTYFEKFENVVPDFVARVWLGDDYAGEVKFKGREVDYKQINVPMKALVPDESKIEKKDLVLFKKGPGRLYYRLGMDYAPKSFDLKAVDYGFIVEREYEAVTNMDDVKKMEDGTWKFKAGELIKVKVRVTNVSRRFHVALVDQLPAGCEVLNPELKGTEKLPSNLNSNKFSSSHSRSPYTWYWWYCYRPWYEHVNLRDERVEAFSSYLYCGNHEYEYVMRATCLGRFVVPPAKAEEMYAPELFGRSSSEIVVIE